MDLPGINRVWARNAAGAWEWRWYAWRGRGAPKIWEGVGPTKAAVRAASVAAAVEISQSFALARAPAQGRDTRTVAGILDAWEASDEFQAVAESTKAERRRLLKDMRASAIGKLPANMLGLKGAPATVKKWRAAERLKRGPRAADYRIQVLSKALNWAKGEGLAGANPAAGMKPLHYSDRSDIIWEAIDLQRFVAAARRNAQPADFVAAEARALLLACYSGLARQDLCALTWAQIGAAAITGKRLKAARRARTAGKKASSVVIPITPELRAVLELCRADAEAREKKDRVMRLHVLLNSFGKPWTPSGLTASFNKTRDIAGPKDDRNEPTPIADGEGRVKRLHDARGTFVTHMRLHDFSVAEIAQMVGWSEADVERIATRYVDAERVALAWLERLKRSAASG